MTNLIISSVVRYYNNNDDINKLLYARQSLHNRFIDPPCERLNKSALLSSVID